MEYVGNVTCPFIYIAATIGETSHSPGSKLTGAM